MLRGKEAKLNDGAHKIFGEISRKRYNRSNVKNAHFKVYFEQKLKSLYLSANVVVVGWFASGVNRSQVNHS